MKKEAIFKLIKDVVIALVAWLVFGLIFSYAGLGIYGFIASIFLAGVPFGWKWLSNIFSAFSFTTIIIKFFLSMILGWIAIFVIIIMDIIDLVCAE